MLASQNVYKLGNENTIVYDQIKRFLTNHSYNSEKTSSSYEIDIRQFFRTVRNKEIEYLTIEDVRLHLDNFEDYVRYLKSLENTDGESKYENKTINRKVSAVKNLLKYLAAKKINPDDKNSEYIVTDIAYLELVNSLPESKNHHGSFETNEAFELARHCLEETHDADTKRLLVLFAIDTCIRKGALLKLRWSDFIIRESDVIVKVVDKGNKHFRSTISKDFYEELLILKDMYDSEYVFNISDRQIKLMMDRLIKKMKLQPERNLCFHSLRKCGITYRYRITGDILEAQRAANHSNVNTTMIYLSTEEYGALGAVSSAGKIDNELYMKVDLETLQKAISESKKDLQLLINMKLNEILNR